MRSFVLRRAAVAVAVAAVFPVLSPVHAATADSADEVLVTASRFANDPAFMPIGATVITAAQIREAGVDNVNEAVRKIGGVYGRQNLGGGIDYSLDLRGFGANSDQNMVVLVDGVRLSENEQVPAQMSAIPIDLVQRIEIMRGGSSVLYGDGATGGVINIITRRPRDNETRGTAFAEAGQLGDREIRASIAQGWNGFSADASAGVQRADNYRDNNETKNKNFSGGLQWAAADARIGVRADVARQDARLPGSLTLAQFEADPRQTANPGDFGSFDVNRYTLFAEQRWDNLEAAAELSRRDKTAKGTFAAFDYSSAAKSHVTQFSPRLRYLSDSDAVKNELVAGVDVQHWDRDTDAVSGGFASPTASAAQKSRGFYLRDEVRFGGARIALGGRHESFDQDFSNPGGFGTTAYDRSNSLNAWELQGSYAVAEAASVFAKLGHSYRMPNVDDNAVTPMANVPLAPQTSRDAELGVTVGAKRDQATVRVFRHNLRNEIYYDPVNFTNTNLDPTRRRGAEFDGSLQVAEDFNLSAHVQHVSADFTEGPNAGRELALVPRNTATLRLTWLPQNGRTADVGLRWVDQQRYGGDFDNSCSLRIPAYTLLDGRFAQRIGGWEFALTGSNLTDKRYFSNAFGACGSGIYPDPGRQLKLSARYDF